MRANPGEDTLVLTSESDLERAAMRRWAGKKVEVEEWTDHVSGTVVLAFREGAAAGANVDTARPPEATIPRGRTARLPWIGRRVRANDGHVAFEGRVARIEIDPIPGHGDVWVHVVSPGGTDDGAYPPDCITPLGDDGPWVEVVLPEEGS